ncbi:MAG: YdeI/OmpD-associated family protein [Solirubrobacterales bacterium]
MGTPETIHFETRDELETWLEANGKDADELWIEIFKKHTGVESLSWAAIVEAVLCFGWIDSQSRRIDDDRYRQRITPRRPRSKWSKINRKKVTALIEAGRMRPAGLAEVERAKADGRWDAAYDSPATAQVPDDLGRALDEGNLREAFDALDSQNRYAILHRIQTVKRADTRARAIEKFCGMLERGEKIHS